MTMLTNVDHAYARPCPCTCSCEGQCSCTEASQAYGALRAAEHFREILGRLPIVWDAIARASFHDEVALISAVNEFGALAADLYDSAVSMLDHLPDSDENVDAVLRRRIEEGPWWPA